MTSPSYSVGQTPFFYQPEVADVIQRIGASRSLVIYAGAGVTIDRTGLGWSGLIRELLMDRDLISAGSMPERLAIRATRHFAPVEAATILKSLNQRRYGVVDEALIEGSLSKKLYSTPGWLDSTLSTAFLTLVIAMAVGGADVYIATTNYETLLEDALEPQLLLGKERPRVVIKVQGTELDEDRRSPAFDPTKGCEGSITLEYLHGRVGKDGKRDGLIALDELDYFQVQSVTPALIEHYFSSDRDVLILGSSLSDPPLLKALDSTKESRGARLALFPIPSFGLTGPDFTSETVTDLSDLMRIRMSAYKVEVLFPDFFSQVSQFLREVYSRRKSGDYDANAYKRALQAWWDRWSAGNWYGDTVHAHDRLRDALDAIRAELALPGHTRATVTETLKLEIWVRDTPHANRRLALWASSAAVFNDTDARRHEPLSLNSQIYAVQAFSSGKPITKFQTSKDKDHSASRWKSYLAVPLVADSEGREVLVGAAVLTSQSEKSRIDPDWATRMQGVIAEMTRVGSALLNA